MSKAKSVLIQRRLEKVTARRSGALSLFERAHQELLDTAAEADQIAQAADERRRHYETLTQVADQEAGSALSSAAELGKLLGKA